MRGRASDILADAFERLTPNGLGRFLGKVGFAADDFGWPFRIEVVMEGVAPDK